MRVNERCGTKLDLQSNGVFELPVEIVLRNARTTGTNGMHVRFVLITFSELEQIEEMMITLANSEYVSCLKRAKQ